MEAIAAMILSIAIQQGVPANFALAVALTENPELNPYAVNVNENGTMDVGIFQLNTYWYKEEKWYDPETNIRAGVSHLHWLCSLGLQTYWEVAIAYNYGASRRGIKPPESVLNYASAVMNKWQELQGSYVNPLIPGRLPVHKK